MKELAFTIILICKIIFCSAQEFSFQMYFEDSIGNIDSITIGYDENGTDEIDIIFDEQNIISQEWDTLFGVRVTNELYISNTTETFNLKKQIVKKDCVSGFPSPISIGIKSKHWPVTAFWKKDRFNSECDMQSVFTSINPGGWWDTGSPSNLGAVIFNNNDSIIFSSQFNDGNINSNYAYSNTQEDSISVFWIGLGKIDFEVSTSEHNLNDKLKLSPNPTKGIFRIHDIELNNLHSIRMYKLNGNLVSKFSNPNIDISKYPNGLYIFSILYKNGQTKNLKVLKE